MLEVLRRLINLLTKAGFTAGTFNAQNLSEYNHDRVMAAGQSLFRTLSLLLGIRDPGDNPTPPIGTSDQRIKPRITINQVLTPINDHPNNEHSGSSQYAPAEVEEDSNDSFEIQRMTLEPKGADLLWKTFKWNAAEAQAGRLSATQFMNLVESEQEH